MNITIEKWTKRLQRGKREIDEIGYKLTKWNHKCIQNLKVDVEALARRLALKKF